MKLKPDTKKWLVNPYHLVEYSPWPLTGSLGALMLTSGVAAWFHKFNMNLFYLGIMLIMITMMQWWRDVTRESTMMGFHTSKTAKGLRIGMILFIISEICFFFAFFWAFFHSSLAPTIELGSNWPPTGINPLSPWSVPLLNTVVLLASGITVTWSHHSLMTSNYKESAQSLMMTILLGLYFTYLQGCEYIETSFSLSDSIYGTTFFVATGFHGLHVIIGTIFLFTCCMRHLKFHFTKTHYLGFEAAGMQAAAWYWHFVDVVWLFLFISIYWWGS
uniref:Cytochrome c oxidase subunit 3 n=1 Tax=Bugula neritina TaxID=10212 RepID=A9UK94_BUGNE|nr:cytochrome c oxidase subunit III [Bugula neritina]AAT79553.1 cytochrome c oxidase subunit III [Bugula neritina]